MPNTRENDYRRKQIACPTRPQSHDSIGRQCAMHRAGCSSQPNLTAQPQPYLIQVTHRVLRTQLSCQLTRLDAATSPRPTEYSHPAINAGTIRTDISPESNPTSNKKKVRIVDFSPLQNETRPDLEDSFLSPSHPHTIQANLSTSHRQILDMPTSNALPFLAKTPIPRPQSKPAIPAVAEKFP